MKGKNTSFRDYLHDAADYIIIGIIVVVVVLIISWRLDILFAKVDKPEEPISSAQEESKGRDVSDDLTKDEISTEETKDDIKEDPIGENETDEELEGKGKIIEENKEIKDKPVENNSTPNSTVNIVIPDGSSSEAISNILTNQGLITDPSAFISKCEEMDISTRLKSGNYTLNSEDSLEEIITTLTK